LFIFFFFKQKTAYEIRLSLVGSEMCIRDSSTRSGYAAINLAHNVSSEEEVKEVLKQATDVGATLVKPPQKADWGGFHGYFKDLDGHLWEVAFNPFMQVGPGD